MYFRTKSNLSIDRGSKLLDDIVQYIGLQDYSGLKRMKSLPDDRSTDESYEE